MSWSTLPPGFSLARRISQGPIERRGARVGSSEGDIGAERRGLSKSESRSPWPWSALVRTQCACSECAVSWRRRRSHTSKLSLGTSRVFVFPFFFFFFYFLSADLSFTMILGSFTLYRYCYCFLLFFPLSHSRPPLLSVSLALLTYSLRQNLGMWTQEPVSSHNPSISQQGQGKREKKKNGRKGTIKTEKKEAIGGAKRQVEFLPYFLYLLSCSRHIALTCLKPPWAHSLNVDWFITDTWQKKGWKKQFSKSSHLL